MEHFARRVRLPQLLLPRLPLLPNLLINRHFLLRPSPLQSLLLVPPKNRLILLRVSRLLSLAQLQVASLASPLLVTLLKSLPRHLLLSRPLNLRTSPLALLRVLLGVPLALLSRPLRVRQHTSLPLYPL